MKAWRSILAVAAVAILAFGVFRLLSEIPTHSSAILVVWLAAALVLHNAILAPSVVGVGWGRDRADLAADRRCPGSSEREGPPIRSPQLKPRARWIATTATNPPVATIRGATMLRRPPWWSVTKRQVVILGAVR